MNLNKLSQWIGKEQVVEAIISVEAANLMQATLNRAPSFNIGDELPPAWHWLYFHEAVQANMLGVEGHPELGGFMPPISFGGSEPPRRMWAGGKFEFARPILLGEETVKRSTIKSITSKAGRSGNLVFVIVEHEITVQDERCLLEEQTIVYREPVTGKNITAEKAVTASPAPTESDFSASYQPDPILLFRYSALTFNSHRIHYDVDFCREHEGYPGLVVHGPLTATLLLDLFYHQSSERKIQGFEYRGHSPLFNPHPFTIHGTTEGQAWASNHINGLAMSAQILFSE